MSRLRLAFMGTPAFAVRSLQALIDAGHDIARVYTRPPRPAGRGQKARASAVQELAQARNLPVAAPATFKDAGEQATFGALDLDAAIVVAYGLLLPKPILDAPRLGCLNVHASLLPRWRGAAPIQRAILAGDRETGITIMRMDEGLDTGPMLLAERTPIAPADTAATLHDRLAEIGAALIVRALGDLAAGALAAVPQPSEGASYAKRLEREEGRLDWRLSAGDLARRIRAFAPWPGAFFEHGGVRFKVLRADAMPGDGKGGRAPGTLLDESFAVSCGEGALRILEIQRSGGAPVAGGDFLRGHALACGTVLGG